MLAGGMDMRKKSKRTAARLRAAAFLLLAGLFLPPVLPHGRMEVPDRVEAILAKTLEEETDPARIQFVYTACALTEQVGYFWGGKSHVLGWDRAWGWPRRVTAPGSGATGHLRPYGLDCSGFVSWAATTAQGDPAAYDLVGEGARSQYALCVPTATPRPGDRAFCPELSHVGIVLGRDGEGTLWVVHCSASLGGVVVTPASVGFSLYGCPSFFAAGA